MVLIGFTAIPRQVSNEIMTWWVTAFGEEQPPDLTVLAPEFTTFGALGCERYIRLEVLDLAALSA